MVKETRKGGSDGASFSAQILHAVKKVRSQKQRPNEERICNVIRQQYKGMKDNEIIEHIEKAVEEGILLRVFSKGQPSYRDANNAKALQPRILHITHHMDLKKVIIRAIKDLNEKGGSTLKQIEKYISQGHVIKLVGKAVLVDELKSNVRKIVQDGELTHEGSIYKLRNHEEFDSAVSTCGDDPPPSPLEDKAVKEGKVCTMCQNAYFITFLHYGNM